MSHDISKITLRPFRSDEWEAVRAIRLQALKSDQGVFLPSYADGLAMPESYWKDLAAQNNSRLFGLYDGDRLIGLTSVFTDRDDPSAKTAKLAMSFIDPDYRGRKLSRLYYEARIAWARSHGFERIVVGHREGNIASRAAMLAHGFKYFESGEITYGDGAQAIDHRYELFLKDT